MSNAQRNNVEDRIQLFNLPLPIATKGGEIVAIRISRELPEREWLVVAIDQHGRNRYGTCGLTYKLALLEATEMIVGLTNNLAD